IDAQTYVTRNKLPFESSATVTATVPPTTGAYAGDSRYIEVNVTNTVPTAILQTFAAATGNSAQTMTVTARAVARGPPEPIEPATISLDPSVNSSTVKGGGGTTTVNGNTYSWGVTKNQSGGLNVEGYAMSRGGFSGTITASSGLLSDPPPLNDPNFPC